MSLVDGARLSGARIVTFAHNDPAALDAVLGAAQRPPADRRRRRRLLDGRRRVAALRRLRGHRRASTARPCWWDEAHSILTLRSPPAAAWLKQSGMNDRVRLQYGTFSKAFAGLGGFVAGPAATIDYLRCYASSCGFSCALPPATVAGLTAALRIVHEQPYCARGSGRTPHAFRTRAQAIGLDTGESCTMSCRSSSAAIAACCLLGLGATLAHPRIVVYPSPQDSPLPRVDHGGAHDGGSRCRGSTSSKT